MKTILTFCILFIIYENTALSQTRDSIPIQQKSKYEKDQFIDQDGDGLPDRNQQQGKKQMKRDQFIDKNGDGICDSREQGLGFQRMRKQSEQTGKQTRRGKK